MRERPSPILLLINNCLDLINKMKKLLFVLLCLPFFGFGQCIARDCENGYGTFIDEFGSKYEGEYDDGKPNG